MPFRDPTITRAGCWQPPFCFPKSSAECSSLWSPSGPQTQAGFLHALTSHLSNLVFATIMSAPGELDMACSSVWFRHSECWEFLWGSWRHPQVRCPRGSCIGLLLELVGSASPWHLFQALAAVLLDAQQPQVVCSWLYTLNEVREE